MKATAKTSNKKSVEKCEQKKCRSHLNRKLFYNNFICDPLNVLSKSMETIITRIGW